MVFGRRAKDPMLRMLGAIGEQAYVCVVRGVWLLVLFFLQTYICLVISDLIYRDAVLKCTCVERERQRSSCWWTVLMIRNK